MLKLLDVLERKGLELVSRVVDSQARKGLRDTGFSANNTRFEVSSSPSGTSLSVLGPAYWKVQESGRRPNRTGKPSRAMVRKMAQWAVRHGMDEGAGYPIAAKIARDGIQVPNPYNEGGVLSEPLDAKRITTELRSEITPLVKQQIKALLFA